MVNAKRNWLFAMMLSGLVACSSTQEFPEEDDGTTQGPPPSAEGEGGDGQGADQRGAEAGGAAGTEDYKGQSIEDAEGDLAQRVFYFEYDSSKLSEKALDTLKAHGKYLATHPEQDVIIEGHTDERGSREYNLALGERRAEAVARVLKLNGASQDQFETVSYGEEKPAEPGHDEQAWAKNRRAELVYNDG